MVILSAAIVGSNKTLLARQFVEMTRLRVEGLLSAFPKLIESSRDHTFIETETVRYVYQPMEALHLLLVTNKSSNILEDLETLRLLAKVVQDCCQIQVNEEFVLKNALDLVFAFDEVVSFGYRESVTLSQVKTYTEMDSHDEKIAEMVKQSKENEAREHGKKKQLELAKLHASQTNNDCGSSMSGGMSMPSFSSSGQECMSMVSIVPSIDTSPSPFASKLMEEDDGPAPLKPNAPKKGMTLGKKQPGDVFANLAMTEPAPLETAQEEIAAARTTPAVVNPLMDPVKVEIDEQIKAKLDIEGGLRGEAECVGDFRVTVFDTNKADLVCFKLGPQDQSFKYKTHPNLNKASYANNTLEVREASKRYKASMPVPLLKWRVTSTNDDFLPITLSCWPSQTAEGTQIVLEYELTDTNVALEDIHIVFPCPANAKASISSAEPGEAAYHAENQQIHWAIPNIDSRDGSSGTLEFNATVDAASLLPYQFTAVRYGVTKCPMDILECFHMVDKNSLSFALQKTSTYVLTVGA